MNKNDYKNIFVFAEQRGGQIQSVALELIGKACDLAQDLGQKVVAVLAGENIDSMIPTLFEYGADEVIAIDNPQLKHYLTEQYAQTIYQVITEFKPNIVLFGATTIGRDLAPRLSARLTTGLTADCTKLEISEEKELMMTRPAFGGNLMATIVCPEHRPQMSTVRPGVMQKKDRQEGRTGVITRFEPKFDLERIKVKNLFIIITLLWIVGIGLLLAWPEIDYNARNATDCKDHRPSKAKIKDRFISKAKH